MASLINRNGFYYAQFHDPDRSPKAKRISLRTKDKSLARAKLARWERAWHLGEADPWRDDMEALLRPSGDPSPTLDEALEDFLRSRREMNATSETLRTYREVLGLFLQGLRSRRLADIKAAELRAFIHDPSLAAATRVKRYAKLRTFLGFHSEEELLDSIPKPRLEQSLPIGVRPEELRAICKAIKEGYRRGRRKGWTRPGQLLWRIPAFWTSLLTGLRRSEIARLKWRDVDLSTRTLTLREQKSRKEERLPISEKAASLLSKLPHRAGWVFRSRYTDPDSERDVRTWGSSMSRAFRQYRDKAGVREELDFHALRKGFCSELARAGASAHVIKRAARHASIQTSLRYVELYDDTIREELDGMF